MQHRLLLAVIASIAGQPAFAADAPRIAKCKDANGVWHYGDTAADECARSKVTVINNQGVSVKEIAAPLTRAELEARERKKAQDDVERQSAEERMKRDRQLLASYGHEDDIMLARDRKLADVRAQKSTIESTLETLRATLTRMQTQAAQEQKGGKVSEQAQANIAKTEQQIAKQEAALLEREKDKELIKQRYEADLVRYRQIKGIPVSKVEGDTAKKP